ncbi:MAG: hypothetical protein EXR79_08040 [Myxococcales bacterium]|nr:hypothetical protein [Myxococcales bacterium]
MLVHRPLHVPALTLIVLLAALATGCVVNAGSSRRGILEVRWAPPAGSTCASLGAATVRVRIERDGALYEERAGLPCTRGVETATVPEGVYSVRVEGISAAGTLVGAASPQAVSVLSGFTQTVTVTLAAAAGVDPNAGAVAVAWTVLGDTAATGCAKHGIKTVMASVLDDQKAKILASVTVSCAAGHASIANVPPGSRFVQLDGVGASGKVEYGNLTLTGPIQVFANAVTDVQPAIDMARLQAAGAVAAAWTVHGLASIAGCAKYGIKTVALSVLDEKKAKILATVTVPCADGQATVDNVAEGQRYVQLDGFTGQGANQPEYGNATLYGPVTVLPDKKTAVPVAVDMVKLGAAAASGSLSVSWTVQKQAAAAGCAAAKLATVYVTVLDETKSKALASVQAPCSAGAAKLVDLPAGTRWVQIDAAPSDGVSWGNLNLAGPIDLKGDMALTQPLDIDLRTVVTLNWKFVDGGSCGQHNVGDLFVEVRDAANKVVVTMKDKDAKKPCVPAADPPHAQRVIDLASADGLCAVPPGAKGLVFCNVSTATLGIAIAGLDMTSKTATFGGSMKIENVKPGTYNQLSTAFELKACSPTNPCTAP